MPQDATARFLGIDSKTLRKYYDDILETASNDANSKIANVLYRKCIEDENMSAITFWLKTRAKWRETDDRLDKMDEFMDKMAAVRLGAELTPEQWAELMTKRNAKHS